MAVFDMDAYYLELDAKMAAPDEPMAEFQKRKAEFRQSFSKHPSLLEIPQQPGWSFDSSLAMHKSIPSVNHSRVTPPADDPARSSEDSRENSVRKSPELSFSVLPFPIVADQSISAQVLGPDNQSGENIPPQGSNLVDHTVQERLPQTTSPQRSSSPSRDEIESFTLGIIDAPLEKKTGKRKSTDDDEGATIPPKKRQASNLRSPQDSGLADTSATRSPISSFPDIKAKRGQREEPVLVTNKPQLHFVPLDEANLTRVGTKHKGKTLAAQQSMKSKKDEFEPPTSPIEDPSLILPEVAPKKSKALAVAGQPSKLQMELQDRIAKHASVKPRDKVMKVAKQDANSKSTKPKPSTFITIDESDIFHISSSPSSRATSPERTKPSTSKRVIKNEKSRTQVKGKGKAKAKEKPQPMTPAEYARWLTQSNPMSDGPKPPLLQGISISYIGGDLNYASKSTRRRMELVVSHGGNIMAKYDPAVTTHIVTDTGRELTLKELGLKRLSQIPEHIPTVKWNWVATILAVGKDWDEKDVQRKHENLCIQHAAFSSRMEAGIKKQPLTSLASLQARKMAKGQNAASRSTSDENLPGPSVQAGSSPPPENIEANTPAGPYLSPPTSPAIQPKRGGATSSKVTLNAQPEVRSEGCSKDPLAEYYPAVRAQLECNESGWSSPGEVDVDESDLESERSAPRASLALQKQGWTCDNKEPTGKKDTPNQNIIDKLTVLMNLHEAKIGKEDHWRAFSYRKAISALKRYPSRIQSFEEAKGLQGVGEKTARKIMEILQTGDLRRIKYENTADVQVMSLYRGIYGVGKSAAYQWYSAGCRTLDDLREGKGGVVLSHVQKIGLQFYNDINDRMPREEAKAIFELIKPIALQLDSKLFIEIMGSYRRGSDDCGDIDVLITRPTDDGLTHRGVLPKLLRDLHAAGILTEDLALPDDPHDLECIYRGLCRLPHVPGSKRRRIDFLSVPWKRRGGALLYYTGNDFFNRSMRLKAKSMGYSLNQRGLYKVSRDSRGVKFDDGVLVASETEEEIFKILDIPWQMPSERIRG
ncbi:hypothetical protein BJ165DRAFT_1435871 [Panaeolus papilionaceus]|nr:hypothetical protein BJ165DRAFT_1435871 [Panaeolus papilionaceus]